MSLINLFKSHAAWISGAALVLYGALGLFLGRDHVQSGTDIVTGLGLLGLHFGK